MEPDIARSKIRDARRVRGFVVALLASVLVLTFVHVGQPGAGASSNLRVRTDGAVRGRVDLYRPTFSESIRVTNPLFPISRLGQVIQLGREGDVKLRHEITLLPETRFIRWNGRRVETLVSQFVAYGDGRILETAFDFFAQDDRGAVWYFGEEVSNYVDGVLDNHDGTWLAGRDGPPGMIMPAHPRVGDVYRPENIPGLVFEEVTVKKVNQTVSGPRGLVRGVLAVQERLIDGVLEDKLYAPGYGEFRASVPVDDELVKVAVAHRTDRLGKVVPKQLRTLSAGAGRIFNQAPEKRWTRLSRTVARLSSVWDVYRSSDVPPLLASQTTRALDALDASVGARKVADVRQAAIDVAHAALDLRMQFQDPVKIDHNRIDIWERQLFVDEKARSSAGVRSDRVIIDAIDDRTERSDDH